MSDITYVDRLTQKEEKEKVYGQAFIEILYGKGLLSRLISSVVLPIVARVSLLSCIYGAMQKSRFSRRKVKPFIRAFHIDSLEFVEPVEAFRSFNDFFIRKLKKEVRPFAKGEDVLIMPADARYLVFPNINEADGFWVKGKKFSLKQLLQDDALAERFEGGAMAMARLCPVDYHRFHFPCDGVPGTPRVINGPLYSVNPLALKHNIEIISQNKRAITVLQSKVFGSILYIEIGATNVGSIHQTFTPDQPCAKGDEKGYFSFGGSCLVLLFEPNRIAFDPDLIDVSSRKMEVRGLLGQSLAKKI
ncbi:MAG: phosphatidylserine decarboxylase [Verrucomicrobia bacterium]|nr:phosphatidylserine decarboxylase [Verrucomicrobiota bacterium]